MPKMTRHELLEFLDHNDVTRDEIQELGKQLGVRVKGRCKYNILDDIIFIIGGDKLCDHFWSKRISEIVW